MGVVIATAGHVDHGKSTLVHALTGMDPDRLKDEKKRGLTIELGFAWADFEGRSIAFVDVPGHEKFVTTMLAGVGAVPVALLVVAADDGWMPQTSEHVAALDALGVRHAVVAITRSDLADPGPTRTQVEDKIGATSLRDAPIVAVSATTGQGVETLRQALVDLARETPRPSADADVRLWVDRKFHVAGAGTVVTATLPGGTISTGQRLLSPHGQVRVRGIESLNTSRTQVRGPARVALNLTGDLVASLRRGDPLWTDGVWQETNVVDLRIHGGAEASTPRTPMWHMGAYSTQVRLRMLDDAHAQAILPTSLPLRQGDRVILRDPGDRRLWGGVILDPVATRVKGLGARTQRVEFLSQRGTTPDYHTEVARFGAIDSIRLKALGIVPPTDSNWHMDPEWLARRRQDIYDLIVAHDQANPANPGMPPAQVVASLDLPIPSGVVVSDLLDPRLRVIDGKITSQSVQLPPRVDQGLAQWAKAYGDAPFQAPTIEELRSWGLTEKDLAAAARLKRVFLPATGVVLSPRTPRLALEVLRGLPQPFTTSQARQAWGTSRRVAIPLLEFFDRARITRRLPDNRREIISD